MSDCMCMGEKDGVRVGVTFIGQYTLWYIIDALLQFYLWIKDDRFVTA